MARKLLNYAKWTADQWQQYRSTQKGIGGSDIATVLGVNKYKSARRLWAELTGAVQREDISDKPAVKMGHKLEPVVADLFAEETGYTVRKNNWILQHDSIDYLYANIDREVWLPDGTKAVLEIKTANVNMKKMWQSDSVPKEYMAQVQFYLMITGYQKAFMAVLIGGVDFDYWIIERDDLIISEIETAAAAFWHCVENGIEPPTDGSEDAAKLLLESFQEADKEKFVDLDAADLEKFEVREILQEQKKEVDLQIKSIDNYFKDRIGKAEAIGARVADRQVKWGFTERRKVDETALAAKYPGLWKEWQEACKEFEYSDRSRMIRY
jgi:putative phage-type endonuclease